MSKSGALEPLWGIIEVLETLPVTRYLWPPTRGPLPVTRCLWLV